MKSVFNYFLDNDKMTVRRINTISILFSCLFVCMSVLVHASTVSDTTALLKKYEYTKTIKKDLPITSTGTVMLNNRYGKIEIKTWDKDRVKIDVHITVDEESEGSAQVVFNRIKINFSNRRDLVAAETEIQSSSTQSWWNFWSVTTNDNFEIDYEVFMPYTATLELSNRYGNVIIPELAGDANVTVKYGNCVVDGVRKTLDMTLSYGNGIIGQAQRTNATIAYGSLDLQQSKNVNLNTKYSKINIELAEDMQINSAYDTYAIGQGRNINSIGKYDNITIERVKNFTAKAKYSDYVIGNIYESANFDLNYGGARIHNVKKGFSEVVLLGNYADYRLSVERGIPYILDANTNYAGISYPNNMVVDYEKEDGTSQKVEGYMINKNVSKIIKVDLNYGGLKID